MEVTSLRNFFIQVSRIRNVVYRPFLTFHGRFVYLQLFVFLRNRSFQVLCFNSNVYLSKFLIEYTETQGYDIA